MTALMDASASGHIDIVKELISAGADVNAKNYITGKTALIWASDNNNFNIVKILKDAGAKE